MAIYVEDIESESSEAHKAIDKGRVIDTKEGQEKNFYISLTMKTFEQNINTSSYMLYDQLQGREEKRFSHCSRSTSEER